MLSSPDRWNRCRRKRSRMPDVPARWARTGCSSEKNIIKQSAIDASRGRGSRAWLQFLSVTKFNLYWFGRAVVLVKANKTDHSKLARKNKCMESRLRWERRSYWEKIKKWKHFYFSLIWFFSLDSPEIGDLHYCSMKWRVTLQMVQV